MFEICLAKDDNLTWCGAANFNDNMPTVHDYLLMRGNIFIACDRCIEKILNVMEERVDLAKERGRQLVNFPTAGESDLCYCGGFKYKCEKFGHIELGKKDE